MPTITKQSKIDAKAQAILENLFIKSSWIMRRDFPDIFIDYVIEPVENDEPTGERFCVQLKGATQLKYASACVKQVMKTKHLLYYHEKCILPVFIISVDVEAKKAFWICAQEFTKDPSVYKKLKSQDAITVDIPIVNELIDFNLFALKVRESHSYMRSLRPGGIVDAVRAIMTPAI